METKYGDIVLRRPNKTGMICFLIMAILIIAFSVLDGLWVGGVIALPSVFEPQYQILYFLWVIFLFVGLGIDKISIGEQGYSISTLFSKKQETAKTELAYVLDTGKELIFVTIVATLGLNEPINSKALKKGMGVIAISSKYKDKVIERGYEVRTGI